MAQPNVPVSKKGHNKTNKQKFKVCLRQGSEGRNDQTHGGVEPLSQIIGPRKQDSVKNKPWN
jgi:hypothetical protein